MKRNSKISGCDIVAKDLTLDYIRTNMIGKKYKVTTTCEFFPEFNNMIVSIASAILAKSGEILIQCRNHYGRVFNMGANMKDLVFHECSCYDTCQ